MRGWNCRDDDMDSELHCQAKRRLAVAGLAGLLLLLHFAWYLGVWPGPMGQDGYSLIANINQGSPRYTGKEAAWLLYALLTYGTTHRVEALVIPSIFLHVLIFTRIISWTYAQGHRKSATFGLIFIALTPHVLNFETSLYPDSIFSLAFIGILFEIWISLKNRKLNAYSAISIITLLPIAAFFKGNGILIIIPTLYLASRLKGGQRWIVLITIIFWITVVQVGGKFLQLGKGHGALKPLILFETINFMQSRPMNLWENRHMVTDKTKTVIHQYISQENIDSLFDRDYWDTLWHQNHEQVKFRHMTKTDSRILKREFFKYNLWRNIPAFTSSRVNIFLASCFAQGGMVSPNDAQRGLQSVDTRSTFNVFNLKYLPQITNNLFERSYSLRFLLWSPLFGIYLIFRCTALAISQKNLDSLIITSTLISEMAGIFIFSIAAEYRYVLIIFFSPLLLLPLLSSQKTTLTHIKCQR